VVPSLQVTGPLPDPDEDAAAVAAGAAAAGAAALPAPPELAAAADLFTPPWPEQAPRPPCGEVLPSLQVTGPVLEPDEADEADAAAPAAGAGAASEPEADVLAPAAADLSMPP